MRWFDLAIDFVLWTITACWVARHYHRMGVEEGMRKAYNEARNACLKNRIIEEQDELSDITNEEDSDDE